MYIIYTANCVCCEWTTHSDLCLKLILQLSLSPSLHHPGSLLLDSLKEHISTIAQDHCKAIYLHVLTTNNTAIHFYENRDFRQHHYLPYYYSIRGVLKDGFTYVLYINGGHPPWTILYPCVEAREETTYSLLVVFVFTSQLIYNISARCFCFNAVTRICQLDMKYKCFLNWCPYWLHPAHWFNPGQPKPLLHPAEIIPTSPVFAALPATLVQYRL